MSLPRVAAVQDKYGQEHVDARETKSPHRVRLGRLAMKTVTYRIVSTMSVIGTTWLFSGQLELALEVGVVGALLRAVPYAVHEWVWSHFSA